MITYPLNNIDYTAEDAELYFSTRESGVYDGNDFEVTVSGIDNDVTVGTGIAWIHNTKFSGKVVALKEPKTLILSLPNSVYDRIDAIVIQFDANDNATNIIVKEGIASSSPVAPAVVRTESLYELHIFHVQRKAGATVISVDNLVDLRNDSNYCGIMFDPISSIDATLTKRGYAADAKAVGDQLKAHQLLDNSDFMHFVAQAGIGGKHGTQSYAGCRWILDNGTVTGEANAKNDGYKNITLNGAIRQIVANPPTIGTVAIEMVSGTASAIYKDGAVTINSNGGVIKNVRLFEGEYTAETIPPYILKGYGAELLECQRYFQILHILVGDGANAPKRLFVPIHPHMRVTPTATVTHTGSGTPNVSVRDDQTIDITCSSGYADTNIVLSADL